jgi:hypothetical protein
MSGTTVVDGGGGGDDNDDDDDDDDDCEIMSLESKERLGRVNALRLGVLHLVCSVACVLF